MAATITVSGFTVAGNKRKSWGTGQLGTYAADGIAVTAAQFGLNVLDQVIVSPSYDAANNIGCPVGYDRVNGKLTALYQTDPAAVGGANVALVDAAAADLSLQIFSWEAQGF